jgi:hypothetical protein
MTERCVWGLDKNEINIWGPTQRTDQLRGRTDSEVGPTPSQEDGPTQRRDRLRVKRTDRLRGGTDSESRGRTDSEDGPTQSQEDGPTPSQGRTDSEDGPTPRTYWKGNTVFFLRPNSLATTLRFAHRNVMGDLQIAQHEIQQPRRHCERAQVTDRRRDWACRDHDTPRPRTCARTQRP